MSYPGFGNPQGPEGNYVGYQQPPQQPMYQPIRQPLQPGLQNEMVGGQYPYQQPAMPNQAMRGAPSNYQVAQRPKVEVPAASKGERPQSLRAGGFQYEQYCEPDPNFEVPEGFHLKEEYIQLHQTDNYTKQTIQEKGVITKLGERISDYKDFGKEHGAVTGLKTGMKKIGANLNRPFLNHSKSFNIPKGEKIWTSYYCTVPNKAPGELFISTNYLLFASDLNNLINRKVVGGQQYKITIPKSAIINVTRIVGPKCKSDGKVRPMKEKERAEKDRVPNAVWIRCKDETEFTFTNFVGSHQYEDFCSAMRV